MRDFRFAWTEFRVAIAVAIAGAWEFVAFNTLSARLFVVGTLIAAIGLLLGLRNRTGAASALGIATLVVLAALVGGGSADFRVGDTDWFLADPPLPKVARATAQWIYRAGEVPLAEFPIDGVFFPGEGIATVRPWVVFQWWGALALSQGLALFVRWGDWGTQAEFEASETR